MSPWWQVISFLLPLIFFHDTPAQSLRLACQFVPYAHCTMRGSLTLQHDVSPKQLEAISVVIEHDSVTLSPGLFEAWISLRNPEDRADERSIATRKATTDEIAVHFRVRDDHVTMDPRFTDISEITSRINDLRDSGLTMVDITSQRIPILVTDRSAVSSRMKATVEYFGAMITSSAIFMRPTNGCWYDEPSCVTGKPTTLPSQESSPSEPNAIMSKFP